MCQKTTCCSNTATCQTDAQQRGRNAPSAREVELERELSQCRAGMAYYYGLATELVAVSKEVNDQLDDRVEAKLKRRPPVGWLVDGSPGKPLWWLKKLNDISVLATTLQTNLSLERELHGTKTRAGSCSPSTMYNYPVQAQCSERWMALHLRNYPSLKQSSTPSHFPWRGIPIEEVLG